MALPTASNLTLPQPPPSMFPASLLNPMLPLAPNPLLLPIKKGKGEQPLDKWSHLPPNNTVYVNNLNEKISRAEIVNGLREVFGQYGKIMDIVCYTKIQRCKGQAWVVFEKLESATKCVSELQNFSFFDKNIHVAFSKNISDATQKQNGQPIPNRERPPKKKKIKKKPVMEENLPKKKKKKKKTKDSKSKNKSNEKSNEKSNNNNNNNNNNNDRNDKHMDDIDMIDVDDNNNNNNNHRNNHHNNMNKPNPIRRLPQAPPNKTLFLQNLPRDAKQFEVERIFGMYQGFIRVNLIENKPGIGFVEFETVYHSAQALHALTGFSFRNHDLVITFAQ